MKINKMKKVLIALDYDPTAQKVAELGFSMAKGMNAEVVLLHVTSNPAYYSSTEYSPIMGFTGYMNMDPSQLDIVEELKKGSQQFLDKSKHHLGDETIQTVVKEGDFAEAILNTAKELHADVIVMGSHSKKWLENIIMGSVTEEVLHHTSIPLFIVPTKKEK
ncbi:MAG: universal stress protein [Ignavibacteriales bacterium]|nr:universal stress protein [Ignavibacteriales bacterium]